MRVSHFNCPTDVCSHNHLYGFERQAVVYVPNYKRYLFVLSTVKITDIFQLLVLCYQVIIHFLLYQEQFLKFPFVWGQCWIKLLILLWAEDVSVSSSHFEDFSVTNVTNTTENKELKVWNTVSFILRFLVSITLRFLLFV